MPGPDEEPSDEVDYQELDERLELDYTIGEDIKERVSLTPLRFRLFLPLMIRTS
jgi:hypothetical protein